MSFFRTITLAISIAVTAGCAAKPIMKGDSLVARKTIIFPKIGEAAHAVVGSTVHIHADYYSKSEFFLEKPISIRFFLGKVEIPEGVRLYEASLEGEPVHCTQQNAYFDPLVRGPIKVACFRTSAPGTFDLIKVAPGEVWFSKDIAPPINYIALDKPNKNQSTPLKQELIFDGSKDGTLFFSLRIYDTSLETPNQIKPLMATPKTLPEKISLGGALLNLKAFTNNSISYSIEETFGTKLVADR